MIFSGSIFTLSLLLFVVVVVVAGTPPPPPQTVSLCQCCDKLQKELISTGEISAKCLLDCAGIGTLHFSKECEKKCSDLKLLQLLPSTECCDRCYPTFSERYSFLTGCKQVCNSALLDYPEQNVECNYVCISKLFTKELHLMDDCKSSSSSHDQMDDSETMTTNCHKLKAKETMLHSLTCCHKCGTRFSSGSKAETHCCEIYKLF